MHLTPRGARLRETTGSRDAPGKQVHFLFRNWTYVPAPFIGLTIIKLSIHHSAIS